MWKAKAYKLSSKGVELASISKLDDHAREFVRLNNLLLKSWREIRNATEEAKTTARVVDNIKGMYEGTKRDILKVAKEVGLDVSSEINANDKYLKEVEQTLKDLQRMGVKI